jgi:hypothetical protein
MATFHGNPRLVELFLNLDWHLQKTSGRWFFSDECIKQIAIRASWPVGGDCSFPLVIEDVHTNT